MVQENVKMQRSDKIRTQSFSDCFSFVSPFFSCQIATKGHARDVHVSDEIQQVSFGRAHLQVHGRIIKLWWNQDDLLQRKIGKAKYHHHHCFLWKCTSLPPTSIIFKFFCKGIPFRKLGSDFSSGWYKLSFEPSTNFVSYVQLFTNRSM